MGQDHFRGRGVGDAKKARLRRAAAVVFVCLLLRPTVDPPPVQTQEASIPAQRRPIPAMEPPAKRMRLSHAIGADKVDESHPDYIEGQRRNNEQLKSSFEGIFAKYAALSDMMSDEIDMRTGEIVKDRGHMRSLDKEYRKQLRRQMAPDEEELPDDLFANDPHIAGEEEGEESDGDERDELAPSMSPEPTPRRLDAVPPANADVEQAPPLELPQQVDIPVPDTPVNALQASLPTTATPAAHLLQLVQFPQTPAGQQARRTFEVQTAQAVQQAVASILSSLLPNTSALQLPPLDLLQSPATPSVNPSEVAPAVASNIFSLPQPSSGSVLPTAAQSSPVTVSHTKRRRRAMGVQEKTRQSERSQGHAPLVIEEKEKDPPNVSLETEQPSANEPIANEDTIETSGRRRRRGPFIFTEEDDQHIIESKVGHKLKWFDIVSSRAHWKNWPLHVFHHHWSKSLAKKAARMDLSHLSAESGRAAVTHQLENPSLPKQSEAKSPSSPIEARHLPTPSSLEKDEDQDHHDRAIYDNLEDTIASGGHFDDDEKDLLSIYGDGIGSPVNGIEDNLTDDNREIPETPLELTQEDSIQQLLQGTVTRENTADIAAPSVEAQNAQIPFPFPHDSLTTQIPSSPTASFKTPTTTTIQQTPPSKNPTINSSFSSISTAKLHSSPTLHRPTTDLDLDLDLVPPTIHTCPLCKQTFPTPSLLHAHTLTPHPKFILYRPSSPLPSTQFDPLATEDSPPPHPRTPTIKTEPVDTPGNFLLSSPRMETPVGKKVGGGEEAMSLRRSAYKRVKAGWAVRGRGTPVGKGRRSLKGRGKRGWEGEESEDELGR